MQAPHQQLQQSMAQLDAMQARIDASVINELRAHTVAVFQSTSVHAWRDTRPMLDPRERSPASIDISREALAYALQRGLAARHPADPDLIRLTREA